MASLDMDLIALWRKDSNLRPGDPKALNKLG